MLENYMKKDIEEVRVSVSPELILVYENKNIIIPFADFIKSVRCNDHSRLNYSQMDFLLQTDAIKIQLQLNENVMTFSIEVTKINYQHALNRSAEIAVTLKISTGGIAREVTIEFIPVTGYRKSHDELHDTLCCVIAENNTFTSETVDYPSESLCEMLICFYTRAIQSLTLDFGIPCSKVVSDILKSSISDVVSVYEQYQPADSFKEYISREKINEKHNDFIVL